MGKKDIKTPGNIKFGDMSATAPVPYTHLRAHETREDLG